MNGYELSFKDERKRFLAERCYFQAVGLPGATRDDLLNYERELELAVKPKYSGVVKKAGYPEQRPSIDATSLNRIQVIGFSRAGTWKLNDEVLSFELLDHAKVRNVLYAFVVSGELKYIGKTIRTLEQRMTGYKTPGPSQTTNIKNHKKIVACLEDDLIVEIYALPDNGLLHFGGFYLNLAAGLEDSLIAKLNPPWNGGQKDTE